MFKYLVLMELAIFFVTAAPERKLISLVPEASVALSNSIKECSTQASDAEELYRILRGDEECTRTDDEFKKFLFCAFHKPGFLDHDAVMDVDKCAAAFPDKDSVLKFMPECNKLTGNSIHDTTYVKFKCYLKYTPVWIKF